MSQLRMSATRQLETASEQPLLAKAKCQCGNRNHKQRGQRTEDAEPENEQCQVRQKRVHSPEIRAPECNPRRRRKYSKQAENCEECAGAHCRADCGRKYQQHIPPVSPCPTDQGPRQADQPVEAVVRHRLEAQHQEEWGGEGRATHQPDGGVPDREHDCQKHRQQARHASRTRPQALMRARDDEVRKREALVDDLPHGRQRSTQRPEERSSWDFGEAVGPVPEPGANDRIYCVLAWSSRGDTA
mmetsp:Transcript_81301/g.263714  ORF Transcript_81301/g.263714 Transcript_81301/m.263714 type:complete len:243 (+) Transcript_81301:306-1034(+)